MGRLRGGGGGGGGSGRACQPPCEDLVKSALRLRACGVGVLLAGGFRAKLETGHGDSQHRGSTCVC